MIVGKVYTVSEINRMAKQLFHSEPAFANLQIQGEISNFKQYPSGHCYFYLKDGNTILKAVLFAGNARRLKTLPKNGDQVLGIGRIDVYERDGAYQFYVDMLMPLGAGNLMVAFEALKQKLQAEGLFDPEKKRPIPARPRVVGIVTSSAGAAVRDIINVSGRRDPGVALRLYPVKVQGTDVPREIIHGIQFMNRHALCDVLIVGRGGGSMEDLWAFNDEGVVRAIAASQIPVISAVGHEVDFTLSDFAADLRAPTPSAAAELAVPERTGDREKVIEFSRRLLRTMETSLVNSQTKLEHLSSYWALTHPERLWEGPEMELDRSSERLKKSWEHYKKEKSQALALLTARLSALDPYGVLQRGYTLTETLDGKLLTSPEACLAGELVRTHFAKGSLTSSVRTIEKG